MLPTSADGSDYSILHPTQALFPLAESGEFVPQSLGLFVCVYVCVCGMWDLTSPPGIKPMLPAAEGQSLNHLTARKVPVPQKFGPICIYCCNHTIYLNKTKLMKSDCKKEKVMF